MCHRHLTRRMSHCHMCSLGHQDGPAIPLKNVLVSVNSAALAGTDTRAAALANALLP
ncbi:hypothetical protein BOX15_Mlig014177g1 [Macrostomum lignano]|uniref:Uncharacterized protein n=1 Tax=Macrostomum lignano TaxID=282301 RepID=A0A267GMU3_9PLAT|nr:hypothetical protein BOX15_Mlig014177g2 [Macrostomum lignano]PAA86622.1 hypothetical protein BOX15_Mlig014177g1 [Macrostomum lignano]